MKNKDKETEAIKAALTTKRKKEPPFTSKDLLSSGVTLLDLHCSGKTQGGFAKGHIVLVVGDSGSGKSLLSMTCLAESTINPNFKNHRLIFDNVENGSLFDAEKFFGKEVAERLEPPAVKDGEPVFSSTVEDFYFHVDDACQKGEPFLYVLDSMDGLTDEDEQDKFQERKEASRKGKLEKVSGSYGTSKAKLNSSGIRLILNKIRTLGSIIVIITQTRDNIGFGAKFNPKTRGGGRALKFYASLELWFSTKGHIKKTVRGKDRELGITAKMELKKNRLTGRLGTVEVPIYWSHGIDNVGSMVDWLVEEGHWPEHKGKIVASDWEWESCRREDLIRKVEEEELEQELQSIVAGVWGQIEEACSVQRKNRYS